MISKEEIEDKVTVSSKLEVIGKFIEKKKDEADMLGLSCTTEKLVCLLNKHLQKKISKQVFWHLVRATKGQDNLAGYKTIDNVYRAVLELEKNIKRLKEEK